MGKLCKLGMIADGFRGVDAQEDDERLSILFLSEYIYVILGI